MNLFPQILKIVKSSNATTIFFKILYVAVKICCSFFTTNMSNEGNKIHAKRIILITWSIVFFREQNIGSRLQCKQFSNNPCFYGLIYLKCSRFIIFCLEPNKYAPRKNMLITLPINLFSVYFKVCKSTKIWNYKNA